MALEALPGNIESVKSVLVRTKLFLDDIMANYNNDAEVLMVTHGGAVRGLHFNLVGYDENNFDWWSTRFENAEMRKYEI